MKVNDLLAARIRRNPPQTQQEVCRLTARQSLAALGPSQYIRGTAIGLARGLFGEAYENASAGQRLTWVRMCEAAYREALSESERSAERKPEEP